MATYSIKDLERLSGIKAHTIRIWEKRYNLLQPERSETNIRHYTDKDLRKLLNVSFMVKNGRKISHLALLSEELLNSEILYAEKEPMENDDKIDQLIRLMVHLDILKFEETIEANFTEMGIEDSIAKVIFPLLQKIGILWHTGSIFPAHEHFVSEIIRNKLIAESAKLNNPASEKTILFFLKEGEHHELSLLYYQFLAKKAGLRTIYLGANVPFNDLQDIASKYHFEGVFTVFINPVGKVELEKYIHELTVIFRENNIYISGAQLVKDGFDFPGRVNLITSALDFRKHFPFY